MAATQDVCAVCGGEADRLARRSMVRIFVRSIMTGRRIGRSELLCDACWRREGTQTIVALSVALIAIALIGSVLALAL